MTTNAHMDSFTIETERLRLVPATATACRAAAALNRAEMSRLLDAEIATDWPPDLLQDALEPTAQKLDDGTYAPPWSMYWIVLQTPRRLIGTCGLYTEPKDGIVGLGYSVVASEQCKGYATEATRGLVEFAFGDRRTTTIVGETMADLTPSIRVMEKLGFQRTAEGVTGINGDENVVRFELHRDVWDKLSDS